MSLKKLFDVIKSIKEEKFFNDEHMVIKSKRPSFIISTNLRIITWFNLLGLVWNLHILRIYCSRKMNNSTIHLIKKYSR